MFLQDPDTFWTLLQNKAHWEFELFLMLLFDGIVGAMLWPFAKKHWQHHLERDKSEAAVVIREIATDAGSARQSSEYPRTLETMRIINSLTTEIKDKAFDPEWFLLRQRLEAFEDSKRGTNGEGD